MPSNKLDQFSTATQTNLQSQLTIWSEFANKSFEHAARLADLNVNACKRIFEESALAAQHLQASQDTLAVLAMTSTQAQTQIEKALSYGRQLGEIVACMQTDFANMVKAEVEENQKNMSKIAETTSVTTPDGVLNMASLMKSAIDNVNRKNQRAQQAQLIFTISALSAFRPLDRRALNSGRIPVTNKYALILQ
jgi:phasin family protein